MKFAYIKELYRFVPDDFFEGGSLDIDEVLEQDAKIVYTNEEDEEFDTVELRSILQETMDDSSSAKQASDFDLSAKLHRYISDCGMNRNISSANDVWEFYTVFHCMDYVRWRWEKNNKVARTRVIRPEKGPRNSLSRLWWWAEMTYDNDADDPYHLTKKNVTQNGMQFVLDTVMPMNKKILPHLLQYIVNNRLSSDDVETFFAKARALNASRKIELLDENEISQTFDALMSFG